MTPGIIKKLYHTTPVGLTDEDKQEVYPITATSAVYSAPGESSFQNMSLDNILDALNQGYQYMGKATPTTNPGVYNHKVFYLASDPGTYSYFGNIEVSSLTVLKTSGNGWTADVFNITGGGGGGTAAGYIGTTMVQSSPAPQNLGGISQLNLTSGARIYFGETAYIELDQYGFHFSQGIYSDSFVAAGGIGSPGGGGGGSYSEGNGISLANDIISVRIGTGLAFDSNGNLTATGGGSYVLPIASASTLGGVKIGSGLSIDSEGVLTATGGGGGGSGTVTSVTLTQGSGISITNSGVAITTSGSRTISIASETLQKIENGNTAYGWGNHANAGYAMAADLAALATRVTNIEDWFEVVTVNGQQALHAKSNRAIYSDSWIAAGGIGSGSSGGGTDLNRVWDSLTNNTDKPNVKINIAHIPDITISKIIDLESWIAGKGYLTSYTETDPTVPSWAKASSKPSYSLSEISGTSDLQAIEALTGTSGLLRKTAANTWSLDTTSYLTSGTTLDSIADGSTRKLADYVTLAGAQTITGAKTFSGDITMSGANIEPLTDSTCSLGYSSKRFSDGNIRNLHVTTFDFRDGSSPNTQVGGIYCGGDIMQLQLGSGGANGYYNFGSTTGVFHNVNGAVPCGRSDHRWSDVYSNEVDIKGGLVFRNSSGNKTGYISAQDGYMFFQAGTNIESSYKQITFHESNGFYPEQSGVNLGYNGANYRWATIYGVNANLSGNLSLSSASYIDIGPVRITYDSNNEAIHITTNDATNHPTIGFYADGFVAAGGVGQTS